MGTRLLGARAQASKKPSDLLTSSRHPKKTKPIGTFRTTKTESGGGRGVGGGMVTFVVTARTQERMVELDGRKSAMRPAVSGILHGGSFSKDSASAK